MRAESAVEPTKSENITVTWRRSAVSVLGEAASAEAVVAAVVVDRARRTLVKLNALRYRTQENVLIQGPPARRAHGVVCLIKTS